jgi:hypothetical protein
LASIVSSGQARVDPRLAGEWSGSIPGLPINLVLQFESFGPCRFAGESGTCQTSGDVLSVSLSAGGQSRYTYRVEGDRLTLGGGAFAAPVVLQRSTWRTTAAPAASPPDAQPMATRPAGNIYQHPAGFSFAYPHGWRVQQQQDVAQLSPAEPRMARQSPAELYFVFGQETASQGVTSPDDPRVIEFLEAQVLGISHAMRRVSGPAPVELDGVRAMGMDWEGAGQRGIVRAKALAVVRGGFGMALLGIGEKSAVESREPELRRIASSFARGGGGQTAAPTGQPPGGPLEPKLIGVWLYEKNFSSGTYSSTNVKTAMFLPDGSFTLGGQFVAGMTHTDSLGGVTGATRGNSGASQTRGRWTASNGKLQIVFNDGSTEVFSYHIEDQSDGRVMLIQTAGGGKQLWTYKGR